MIFSNLSGRLKVASCTFELYCSVPDIEITGILYYDNQDSLRSDILYILFEPSVLSQIARRKGTYSVLLLSQEADTAKKFLRPGVNLITGTDPKQYTPLINDTQQILAAHYHQVVNSHEIMDSVIQNDSLENIFEKVYQSVKNPILFLDSSETITLSKPDNFLEKYAEKIPSLEEFNSIIFDIRKKASKQETPFIYVAETNHKILACNIILDTYSVGIFFMIEYFFPFSENILQEMGIYQKILTHYLAANQSCSHIMDDSASLLLHNLLQTNNFAPIMLERLLNRLRFPSSSGMRFAALTFSARPCNYDYERLIRDIRSLFPNDLYTIQDNAVILLIGNSDEKFEQQVLSNFVNLNSRHHIIIGISNCFYDFKNFHKYYHQALTACDYKLKIPDSQYQHYMIYENIVQLELFHLMNKHCDLMDYVSPDIIRLLKYDNEHRSQLAQTLSVYLNCFGDVSMTASILKMHKNTLYYRLNQIKEFLNNDLVDGETNYQYMFAFRVLQYLGDFYPID